MTDQSGATGANVQTSARRIVPTVGRVLWFWASLEAKNREGSEPYAALLSGTFAGTDRMVNLAVFNASGEHYPATSVPLVQEGEDPPSTGCFCEWMPFQKGQASRTEQLAKELAGRGKLGKGSTVIYRDEAGDEHAAIVTRIDEESGQIGVHAFVDDNRSGPVGGLDQVDPEGTARGWFLPR